MIAENELHYVSEFFVYYVQPNLERFLIYFVIVQSHFGIPDYYNYLF